MARCSLAPGGAIIVKFKGLIQALRISVSLGFVDDDCELELVQDMLHHRELLRVHTQGAVSAEVHHAFYIGVVRKLIKDSNQSCWGWRPGPSIR